MKNHFTTLLTIGLLLFCSVSSAATLVEQNDWKVQLGGFAIGYIYNDSSRSLTEIQGSAPIARPGTLDGDNGRSQFSSRGSRFNFGVFAPKVDGWKTKGLIEADFLGFDPTPGSPAGNSETSFFNNPTLRLRHAYMDAKKDGWQILVGQYWGLFGWDTDYALQTAAQPPVTGVVFHRTPQIRVGKTADLTETITLESATAITRPPQRDAEAPAIDLAARIFFKGRRAGFSAWTQDQKALPMVLAVSGTLRKFETAVRGGGTTDQNTYLGHAVAVNGMIPILSAKSEKDYSNTLALAGEFSTGQGYADQFPGYSGNLSQLNTSNGDLANIDAGQGGYNASGVFSLVHLQSWSAQLQYFFPKGLLEDTFMTAGYGNLYSDNIKNLVPRAGSVAYNESQVYFLNLYHDFTPQYRMALEYLYTETNYVDGVDGKNNRISAFGMFRF